MLWLLAAPCRVQPDAVPRQIAPAGRWVAHHLTLPTAAKVDLSHLGVHTHANFLCFLTGTLNISTMQADKSAPRYRRVRVVGHCRLPTARAALPPDFAALQRDVGAIPTYGPIDGKPGWSFHASMQGGRNEVIFSVPTRFANWVAGQPQAVRRRYQDPRSYSLEVTWEEWEG